MAKRTKEFKDTVNIVSIVIVVLAILFFFLRISNIGYPPKITWDEIYFITDAQKRLINEGYFMNHPPFGHILTSLSISILGNNPIGWRITQAISGAILTIVLFLIARRIFSYKFAGLLTFFFASFELIFLTYSRIGLHEIYLVLFMSISILLFLTASQTKSKIFYLFFVSSAITCGLAISIKWIALSLIAIFTTWLIIQKRIVTKKLNIPAIILIFLPIVFLTYVLTFTGEKPNFDYINQKYNAPTHAFYNAFVSWHRLTIKSHAKKMFHYDSSKWYTWPLHYKPVWMHFKVIDRKNHIATCIAAFGNPIIWWLGLCALAFQLFYQCFKRDRTVLFLICSYLLCFLPFSMIDRPMFLYHYMPALLFLILILEYTFASLYMQSKIYRPIFYSLLALVVIGFLHFLPFVNAHPVSYKDYKSKLWIDSWEYSKNGTIWKVKETSQ